MEGERTYKEQLREQGLFGLEKKKIQLLFSATKWGVMRWSQTLLGGVQSKRTRGTFCSREVLQGTRGKGKKNVFPVRAVKPWKWLSRVVEFPFWEMFKA